MNSWQNLTWIRFLKLEAKQREKSVSKQHVMKQLYWQDEWFCHTGTVTAGLYTVIYRVMCALSCAMHYMEQISVSVHVHRHFIWCCLTLKTLPLVDQSQDEFQLQASKQIINFYKSYFLSIPVLLHFLCISFFEKYYHSYIYEKYNHNAIIL